MNKFIRLNDVISITGLGKSSIYNMIKEGNFPKNILLGARAVAWVESEVRDWIDSRINASRAIKHD